jgi:hypothetical protein
VNAAIELFAEEAARRLPGDVDTVVAGLCCTHYGYCAEMFSAATGSTSAKAVEIADPTRQMSEIIFVPERTGRFPGTHVTVTVVSRAVISPEEIRSIGGLLEMTSPETATALRQYELKRDLFPYSAE